VLGLPKQKNRLIIAILRKCGKKESKKLQLRELPPEVRYSPGDGAGYGAFGPGFLEWYNRWLWSIEPPIPVDEDHFA
jgi:hypothetical protein